MRAPVEVLWLWAALSVPSWAIVHRYLGPPGVVAYSVAVAAALMLAPRLFAAIPPRAVTAMNWSAAAAMVVLFAVAFPQVNVHAPGTGSDDDDAHDVGAQALMAGESPYSHRTYLGNQLHQLPGAFVLAAPFTLLGTSALQNLVCLPLFIFLLARETRDARSPALLAWLALLLSGAVAYSIVTGSSYFWSAIWVMAGVWWLMARPASLPAALFLGIALCSKPNFLLLLAPLLGWLWRQYGRTTALRGIVVTTVVALVLVVPFYLRSASFGPMEAFDRIGYYDVVFPGTGLVIAVGMALVACGLAFVRTDRAGLFLQCAAVQAFPVAVGLLLSIGIDDSNDQMRVASYGQFAACFAVMGAAIRLEPWLSAYARPNSSGLPPAPFALRRTTSRRAPLA